VIVNIVCIVIVGVVIGLIAIIKLGLECNTLESEGLVAANDT
jgi:hypothetical protein